MAGLKGVVGPCAIAIALTAWPAFAAEDNSLERLATCQDSWIDWQQSNDKQLAPFAAHLRADFTQKSGDPFITPKSALTIDGLRVVQVYPESIGMGVGFSVLVAAKFDDAKDVLEKTLGKRLQRCETSDGMRSCDHQIAEKRTVTLMSGDRPADQQTLVGCYYFYEK